MIHFADAQRINAAIGHLRTQFETAKPVLFTGSGFSLAVTEATALLKANIAARGAKDAHAYHVLGNNMLEWIDHGIATQLDKKVELETLAKTIDDGASKHPTNDHLKTLKAKVQDAYLHLAVARW